MTQPRSAQEPGVPAGPPAGRRSSCSCCPRLVLYAVFVLFPVVQAAHYSLFKWNGLTAADRLHRPQELRNAPSATRLPDGGLAQRPHHRPVARPPDPVRARARRAAEPPVPRSGDPPADLLRPYVLSEAITGIVFSLILQPGARASTGPARTSALGCLIQDWLGDTELRDDHPVHHHLVEVLRVPHDHPAGRPAGHPARDRGSGRRSTAPAAGRRSVTSRCRSLGPAAPGVASSCR